MSVVADRVRVRDGGVISADTAGDGNGGTVSLRSWRLSIDGGSGRGKFTGISTDTILGSGSGDAGGLMVRCGELLLRRGGKIAADTNSRGNGGSVTVHADTAILDGRNSFAFSSISARSSGKLSGRGGDIVFSANSLAITGGARISSSTFGGGAAGTIRIAVPEIMIDGGGSRTFFTGIASDASRGSTGAAGSIEVETSRLQLLGAGAISASSFGAGKGGDVRVTAREGIEIAGEYSAIVASSAGAAATATAGNISVTAPVVRIEGAPGPGLTGISTRAGGSARAGAVDLAASEAILLGGATISSASDGSGPAGSVRLRLGDRLFLDDGSTISTASMRNDAGLISIEAGSSVEMHGGSAIVASAGANGGSLDLRARDLLFIDHSQIVLTAGAMQGESGAGGGAGGNMGIDPDFVILDHALLSANATAGQGGNILLVAHYFFANATDITATGAQAGTVNIASPELNLTNGLVGLRSDLVDTASQLREQCARRLGQDFSSFLVLGRGGVAGDPGEAQPSLGAKATRRGRAAPAH